MEAKRNRWTPARFEQSNSANEASRLTATARSRCFGAGRIAHNRGQMDHGVHPFRPRWTAAAVGDVATMKIKVVMRPDPQQSLAAVHQFVQHADMVSAGKQILGQHGTDVPCPPRNENFHCL